MHAKAEGNGPLAAIIKALCEKSSIDISIKDYSEHTLGTDSHAKAAAYVQIVDNKSGRATYGVGTSSNITRASIRAIFSALNRLNRN